MKKELEYFKIGGSYGGNQDWFIDFMMRIGGCGAVTACDCCIYFARAMNKRHLYPFDAQNLSKRNYIRFARIMKPHLRPRKGGINTLQLYIDGFSGYLKSVSEEKLSLIPLSGDFAYERAASAVLEQIDQGYPVPCLTLHHSKPELKDYVWHWFLLTGYECETAFAECPKQSEPRQTTGGEIPESRGNGAEKAEIQWESYENLKVKAVTYGEYQWLSLKELWDTGYEEKGGLILFSDEV